MTVLIVGLGSIAKKHIQVIKEIEHDVNFIALRNNTSANVYQDVVNIFSLDDLSHKPEFAIVSNPTSKHYATINSLLDLGIPLFIEKPVLMSLDGADKLLREIKDLNLITYVACNLRFHPCIQYLKKTLITKRLYEANIYCGSYLPDWRPDRDYRKVYSAKAEMGGGVHLDLIHEIDYAYWLWGNPSSTYATYRKLSEIEIDSNDYAHYVLEYPNKVVNITLNYYRIEAKRKLEVVFDDDIWMVDLLNNSILSSKDDRPVFCSDFKINDTYRYQMKYFLDRINGNKEPMNCFQESLEVLKICLNE
jgi:predicted dehydrogenase